MGKAGRTLSEGTQSQLYFRDAWLGQQLRVALRRIGIRGWYLTTGRGLQRSIAVGSICCSCRGPPFRSQHPHQTAHDSVTTVLRHLTPSFGLHRHLHTCGTHTSTQSCTFFKGRKACSKLRLQRPSGVRRKWVSYPALSEWATTGWLLDTHLNQTDRKPLFSMF